VSDSIQHKLVKKINSESSTRPFRAATLGAQEWLNYRIGSKGDYSKVLGISREDCHPEKPMKKMRHTEEDGK
jgi:hypothetical protein